jgi:starch synthase
MSCLPTPERGVIVAVPGRILNVWQAALALQQENLLQSFETGFYFNPDSWLGHAIQWLPQRTRAAVERELRRRYDAELDPRLIRAYSGSDLLYSLVARSGVNDDLAERVMFWRNERFEQAVARVVLSRPPAAVVCYETVALPIFEAAEKIGALKIMDVLIGHLSVGLPLLEEEISLHPDFADAFPIASARHYLGRCRKEDLAADVLLVPSDYVRDTLISIGVAAERIVLVPYAVDLARFAPRTTSPEADQPFRLLFVGQIGLRKGIPYLLEAFRRLRLPDAELVLLGKFAGRGKGFARYEGTFRHVDYVPYTDVPAFMRDADLFVYPSLHEGSALAIYEAMASGLPVITTPNSGSVVRDGIDGYIVPIRDVDALAERIETLYRDRERCRQMGQSARERSEQFSWAAYRSRLVSAIKSRISDTPLKSRGRELARP